MAILVLLVFFCFTSYTEACGGTYTASSGQIRSPGYPGLYGNDLDCGYVIRRPRGERITVTFSYMDLESSSSCSFDYVQLKDGDSSSSPVIYTACGTEIPPLRRSFQNSMYIHFHTDGSFNGGGFKLSYTSASMKNSFLLVPSSGAVIFRIDIATISNIKIPNISVDDPVAIDFDPVEQRMYWTDIKLKAISRSYLDGSGRKVLRVGANLTSEGIAVDPVSRLVFYTDRGNAAIAMMTMSGSLHRTIINTDLDQPRAIVLDTVNGVMFWTDVGALPKIERANYDGTDRRTIQSELLIRPNALALDLSNDRIYWADAGTDWVEYSDLNGNGRTQFTSFGGKHFFGLAYHNNFLYATDWTAAGADTSESEVYRLSTVDGTWKVIASSDTHKLNGICVSFDGEWQKGPNGCSVQNRNCSHFCLPSPGLNFTCVCPDPDPDVTCVDNSANHTEEGINVNSTIPEEPTNTTTTTTSTTTATTTSTTTATTTTTTTTSTTTTTATTTTPSPISVTLDGPSVFDTDGRKAVTLICDPNGRKPALEVTWNVPCNTESDRKCEWTPLVPEDDGKEVTCSIHYTDGQLGHGSFTVRLNYPPPAGPVIQGYDKGDKLQEGDSLTMTCLVRGGKPLVTSVHFSCSGHPDSQTDIRGDLEVQSLLTIDPLMAEDDGKRCICTADWKVGELYLLSATTILMVIDTTDPPTEKLPVAAIAGGIAASIFVIIVIVIIIIMRRKCGKPKPDVSRRRPSRSHGHSTLGGFPDGRPTSELNLIAKDGCVKFSDLYDEIDYTKMDLEPKGGYIEPLSPEEEGIGVTSGPKLPDRCKTKPSHVTESKHGYLTPVISKKKGDSAVGDPKLTDQDKIKAPLESDDGYLEPVPSWKEDVSSRRGAKLPDRSESKSPLESGDGYLEPVPSWKEDVSSRRGPKLTDRSESKSPLESDDGYLKPVPSWKEDVSSRRGPKLPDGSESKRPLEPKDNYLNPVSSVQKGDSASSDPKLPDQCGRKVSDKSKQNYLSPMSSVKKGVSAIFGRKLPDQSKTKEPEPMDGYLNPTYDKESDVTATDDPKPFDQCKTMATDEASAASFA